MNFAATLLVAGLSVGSIYAMIAITLNLTYWTTRTVNFGQGSILMLSAMGTIFLARVGLPLGFAVLLEIKKYPNILEIIKNAPASTAKVIQTAINAVLSYEFELVYLVLT